MGMDWGNVISGALGAAGSIAGGLLGGKSGGGHSAQYYADIAYKNQQRLTENQYKWIVDGAKKAGLHPLAALGGNVSSGPSFSFGDSGGNQQDYSWLNGVGQGIGRAAGAMLSKEDRAQAQEYQSQQMALDLDNRRLQNEYLQAQIRATTQDTAIQLARSAARAIQRPVESPGYPVGVDGRVTNTVIPGQGDARTSSLIKVKPAEIVANDPQRAAAEAGSVPEVRYARTPDGGYSPMRSQALEEALEEDLLGSIAWNIRNRVLPTAWDTLATPPPDRFKRKSEGWTYNPIKQAWYPYDRDDRWSYAKRKFKPW